MGNAWFGEGYQDLDEQYQPSWQIPFFNNTHIIFQKSTWIVRNSSNVDILLRVYDFDRSPIQNANLSVVKINRASHMGFETYNNYQVDTTYNVTDQSGYGILKLIPDSHWDNGNYQVLLKVESEVGVENIERWFCVGMCYGG